jgi:hypothetical protein
MSRYGHVKDIRMPKNKTGESKDFVFIEFSSQAVRSFRISLKIQEAEKVMQLTSGPDFRIKGQLVNLTQYKVRRGQVLSDIFIDFRIMKMKVSKPTQINIWGTKFEKKYLFKVCSTNMVIRMSHTQIQIPRKQPNRSMVEFNLSKITCNNKTPDSNFTDKTSIMPITISIMHNNRNKCNHYRLLVYIQD